MPSRAAGGVSLQRSRLTVGSSRAARRGLGGLWLSSRIDTGIPFHSTCGTCPLRSAPLPKNANSCGRGPCTVLTINLLPQ